MVFCKWNHCLLLAFCLYHLYCNFLLLPQIPSLHSHVFLYLAQHYLCTCSLLLAWFCRLTHHLLQTFSYVFVVIHYHFHQLCNIGFLSKIFLRCPISLSQALLCLFVIIFTLQLIKLEICQHDSFCNFLPDVLSIVQVFQNESLCKINGFGERFNFKVFLLKRLVNIGLENENFG